MRDIHEPDEQGFIPFVYNYCDRRCERCRFIRQCRVGIVEADDVDEDRTEVADERVEDYAERLRKVMGLPVPGEEDDREHFDLDVDDLDQGPDPELEARRAAVEKAVEEHPLTKLTEAYAGLVSDWMEVRAEALRSKGVTLHPRAELAMAPVLRGADVLLLSEAMQEILWFQHMLYVKSQRALDGKIEDEGEGLDLGYDEFQSDWNGTAKLTLHIVDRCSSAWRIMVEHWPDEASSAVPLVECLGRCRTLLLQDFPDAQRFVRPGFDAP